MQPDDLLPVVVTAPVFSDSRHSFVPIPLVPPHGVHHYPRGRSGQGAMRQKCVNVEGTKGKPAQLRGFSSSGAEDGIRTRDLLLGKEMLYH